MKWKQNKCLSSNYRKFKCFKSIKNIFKCVSDNNLSLKSTRLAHNELPPRWRYTISKHAIQQQPNWPGRDWTRSVRSADGAVPCRASEWNYKIYISSGFTSILFKFQIYTHCIWSSSQTPFCSANSTVWSFPTTVFVFIIALCCVHERRGVGNRFGWVTELCERSPSRQIIHSDLYVEAEWVQGRWSWPARNSKPSDFGQ